MREQIQRILTKGTFASDVAVMTSGTGLGQLIFLGFSPILMRLFTPEAFGNLALVMSITILMKIEWLCGLIMSHIGQIILIIVFIASKSSCIQRVK